MYEIERIFNEGPKKKFKLLGVLLDEYLTFDDHIINLCSKISKSLFCLNRVKNFTNQETTEPLSLTQVANEKIFNQKSFNYILWNTFLL
jgi:hypothetical protein